MVYTDWFVVCKKLYLNQTAYLTGMKQEKCVFVSNGSDLKPYLTAGWYQYYMCQDLSNVMAAEYWLYREGWGVVVS